MLQKGILTSSLSILFWLILATNLFAQKVNCECFVKGKIIDSQTKDVIAGALIEIKNQKKATFSDTNGQYIIENVCEGKYELNIKILGYDPQKVFIDLTHETIHNFNLNETEIHLEGVNITAKRTENLAGNDKTVDSEQLKKLTGQNLASIVGTIAGVSILQTGTSIGKPIIHGLHSNRILTINNGLRHEAQQWGNEHAPEIDPFLAKKITVIKGAKSVRYGPDAIGGVIIIEPNDLTKKEKIETEINQVFQSNGLQNALSAIAEGSIKSKIGIDWRIQASAKKGGNISTPDYKLANTSSQEFNFSVSAKYTGHKNDFSVFFSQFNSKIGIFSGSHIGNSTDLIDAIGRERPLEIYTPQKFTYKIGKPYQDIQHNLLKLKSNHYFKNNQTLQITFGQQYNFRAEVDALRGDRNTAQIFKINTNTVEALFTHKPLFKSLNGNFGLNGLYQYNISTGKLNSPLKSNVLIPNYQNFTLGFFWIERYFKNGFEFEAGTRFDKRFLDVFYLKRLQTEIREDKYQNNAFSNTFSISKNIKSHVKVGYNIASAWKPAVVSELYSDGVHHGSAAYEIGDLSLLPEKALENSFVFNYESPKYQLEILSYFNRINDYIFIAPTGNMVLTIRGAFPEFKYTQTDAYFKGFDVSNNFIISKKISVSNQTSLLWANDRIRKEALIFIPSNRSETKVSFSFETFWLTDLSLSHKFVAKQNRVPSINIFNNESPIKLIGGDYMAAPSAYNLFDLNLSKKLKVGRAKILTLNMDVKNVLNRKYRDYLNRFRYFSDDQGINFILRCNYIF